MLDLTENGLLDGRVKLRQPKTGYRVSSDAVLLAALAPVQSGSTVLELGTGYGQVALCVSARVSNCQITAVELLPDVASLAEQNIALNGKSACINVLCRNVADLDLSKQFDVVLANPPYRQIAGHDLSPVAAKNYANYEMDGVLLAMWTQSAAHHLALKGAACFIYDAVRTDDLANAFHAAGLTDQCILPFCPYINEPPHRVAIMAKRGPPNRIILPPLNLHESDGSWTAILEDVLRHAAPLTAFHSHFSQNGI